MCQPCHIISHSVITRLMTTVVLGNKKLSFISKVNGLCTTSSWWESCVFPGLFIYVIFALPSNRHKHDMIWVPTTNVICQLVTLQIKILWRRKELFFDACGLLFPFESLCLSLMKSEVSDFMNGVNSPYIFKLSHSWNLNMPFFWKANFITCFFWWLLVVTTCLNSVVSSYTERIWIRNLQTESDTN
jgi:hypothetical protein